jgi:hypothetical protein
MFKNSLVIAPSIDEVMRRVKTPLTDGDLERYFGSGKNSEVMKYSELANYRTIDDLLPLSIDFRIVLVEQEKNIGHWVCILKYKNVIESFNSYGKDIDRQKDTFGAIKNRLLGQQTDYLTKLVKKSKYKYVINKTPFQSKEEGINTCGRWCILRIIAMKDLFMDLEQFKEMVIKGCKDLNVEPDALVSIWIN